MKTLTAIALALACVAASSPAIRAGVAVASEPGQWILAMSGALLPIGSPVTLITPDTPQQVHRAIVSARVPQSPVMTKHNIPGPYYSITAEEGAKALPELVN